MLYSWYENNSNKTIQEVIQSLLNTMKLYWIIHSPIHPITKSLNQISLSKEFYRIGYLTLSHFVSNNKNIYQYFLLPFFKLQFNIPSITSNSIVNNQNSLELQLFSEKWKLTTRKSYKLVFNFSCYNQLINLYYLNLFTNYKVIKINIETIFCIQVENFNNSCNSSSNNFATNHWIISGNIHKLHSININNLNENSNNENNNNSNNNNNPNNNLAHEISVCFTRCGKYLIYPLIRLYIEYSSKTNTTTNNNNNINQDGHQYTLSSPWWITQPETIYTI